MIGFPFGGAAYNRRLSHSFPFGGAAYDHLRSSCCPEPGELLAILSPIFNGPSMAWTFLLPLFGLRPPLRPFLATDSWGLVPNIWSIHSQLSYYPTPSSLLYSHHIHSRACCSCTYIWMVSTAACVRLRFGCPVGACTPLYTSSQSGC